MTDFQDKIACSIKVVELPSDYDEKEIIDNLSNAGQIVGTKSGINDMLITFSNANEKELSKMYDGCPVGSKYTIKLVDPIDLEVSKKGGDEQPKPETQSQPEPLLKAEPNFTEPEPEIKQKPVEESPKKPEGRTFQMDDAEE